jgi:hypothetical protein
MAFQAKDIQEIVRVPKIRYEYLARQIGIVPEIEEGEGTGNAHRYSFKNLIEFAIAERCSLTGLSMHQIKFLMHLLHKHAPKELFKQSADVDFEVWFYGIAGGGMFVWQGEKTDISLYKVSEEKFNESLADYYSPLDKLGKTPDQFNRIRKEIQRENVPSLLSVSFVSDVMNELDGCVHINIGKIKTWVSGAVATRQMKKQG